MNFLERINAVLHHQKPDKAPFAPSENVIPRGRFEREMRNKGMGIYARRATYWSETPNVRVEYRREAGNNLTIYHTPVGTVSTGRKEHRTKLMIEDAKDYEPAIFIITDTVFHADYSVYMNTVRDLGTDGIVRGSGIEHPLQDVVKYIGAANLEREQHSHPKHFSELLKALDQRAEKLLPIVGNSPAELISVGQINDTVTPKLSEEYILPFYQKYLPGLRKKGKICALEVNTMRLESIKNLISQTHTDVVEGFIPPPAGSLSFDEALSIRDDDTIIWIDFPEPILFDGAGGVMEYTKALLRSDPMGRRLIIGLTNIKPVSDETGENLLRAGISAILAILDAIGE